MRAHPDAALFGGLYAGLRVMVTGHTGFKGSWLVHWLRRMGAQVSTLALPAVTQPSHHALLQVQSAPASIAALHAETLVDLSDGNAVRQAMTEAQPELVLHLAAQALVRPSYADAPGTFATNVMGLVHVLEAVRHTPSVRGLLNVTTDKCYQNLGRQAGYRESDALGGHDPYSASKACAELVTASYRDSFLSAADRVGGPVAVATARAGNVIGGGDWSADRLVPDLVRAAVSGQPVQIRYPHATRPWQHVLEPLAAYLLLGQRLLTQPAAATGAWNIGPLPQGHLSVGQVVRQMAECWPAIRHELDTRPQLHEAALLHLDCSRAHTELGWRPVWDAPEMIQHTMAWYRAWHEQGRVLTDLQLDSFVHAARLQGQPWA